MLLRHGSYLIYIMETKSLIPEIISHIRVDDEGGLISFQTNEEHSLGVANLAKCFAGAFGMGNWGYVLGLLHDKGKEKYQFQEYIRDVNGIPGHSNYSYAEKAHAYVGGILAKTCTGNLMKISFPIKLYRIIQDYTITVIWKILSPKLFLPTYVKV